METGSVNRRIKNVFIRFIFNLWTVYCYLISIAFSSGFVPHLTTPEYNRRIESVKDLINTNHFWGLDYQLDLSVALNLNDPGDLTWSKRFILFNNSQEINDNLKKENFALWGKRLNNGFIINDGIYDYNELIDYEVTPFSTAKFYFAYTYRKGSPYSHAIDYYLCRLFETGIVNKMTADTFFNYAWKQPAIREVLVLTKRSYKTQKRLTMQNLRGIFSGLILGYIISFFVIILELITKKANNKPNIINPMKNIHHFTSNTFLK